MSLFRFVPLPGSPVYENAEAYGLHGTHHQPGWGGDWSRFHIHHNARHWWGTSRDWQVVQDAFVELTGISPDVMKTEKEGGRR